VLRSFSLSATRSRVFRGRDAPPSVFDGLWKIAIAVGNARRTVDIGDRRAAFLGRSDDREETTKGGGRASRGVHAKGRGWRVGSS
jgi:hypothetical protein